MLHIKILTNCVRSDKSTERKRYHNGVVRVDQPARVASFNSISSINECVVSESAWQPQPIGIRWSKCDIDSALKWVRPQKQNRVLYGDAHHG